MQVCAAEWRASERSGDDRSRGPFEYNGPAEQSAYGRGPEGQLGKRALERSGLSAAPRRIVKRSSQRRPMQGDSARALTTYDRDRAAIGSAAVFW